MVFCHDVNGLFKGMKQQHSPSDWRLLSDSSQRSLKAVLHNGNPKTSTPIAQSVHLKKTYDNMKTFLETVQYNVHRRNICGNLTVFGMLMGMQGVFTKFCCYWRFWDWNSTAGELIKLVREPRKAHESGRDRILHHIPVINPMKIFLPPFHIKL